jgi:hypothetical protein
MKQSYDWSDCWMELKRLRRQMHDLFERMRTLSPNNGVVDRNVRRVVALAIEFAAEECGVTEQQIKGRRRTAQIAWARHIAIYVTRQFVAAPANEIKRAFSLGDQHSIKYATRRVLEEPLPKYQQQVKRVMDRVRVALADAPLETPGKTQIRQSLKKLAIEGVS